ncbi:hypothetical protein CR513_08872, partial [Mucuna pruriens]
GAKASGVNDISSSQRELNNDIVKDNIRSIVKEQAIKFLHIIGHNVKNRTISFFFHRFGETVSRHFHSVLHVIIALEGGFIIQPLGRVISPQILNNS